MGRVPSLRQNAAHRVAAGEDTEEMTIGFCHENRTHTAIAHAFAGMLDRIPWRQDEWVLVADDLGDAPDGSFHCCYPQRAIDAAGSARRITAGQSYNFDVDFLFGLLRFRLLG